MGRFDAAGETELRHEFPPRGEYTPRFSRPSCELTLVLALATAPASSWREGRRPRETRRGLPSAAPGISSA